VLLGGKDHKKDDAWRKSFGESPGFLESLINYPAQKSFFLVLILALSRKNPSLAEAARRLMLQFLFLENLQRIT
jgi:hypothetical protein